jgi:hypothetical protein
MKIYTKDIEYIKVKDYAINRESTDNKPELAVNELRILCFIVIFPMTSLMFVEEYPFNSFFYNFRNWSFFELGFLKPQDTIAISSALLFALCIDYLLMKLNKWVEN